MLNLDSARAWYPVDDPVHGYDHIVRVYRLAEKLAAAEGADLEIVRAAALLHDAQSQQTEQNPGGSDSNPARHEQNRRSSHQQSAAEFTQRILEAEGWSQERIGAVLHCIRAHRYRDDSENPETLEARVLYDADKLDAIGAVGAARAIAYAVTHQQPIYSLPSSQFLQSGKIESGESHSAYHEYLYKLSRISDRMYTATGRKLARERHRVISQFFDQLRSEMEAGA